MKKIAALIAALAAAGFTGSALADPPPWAGHGKHQEKHEHEHEHEKHADRDDVKYGRVFTDEHRHHVRTYYVTEYERVRSCPPGLAKKHNGCLPPGQAKKLLVGQRVPAGVVYYQVPQPVLVQLPPPPAPGYRYVRIGNDIVLLSPQSQVIVDVIHGLIG